MNEPETELVRERDEALRAFRKETQMLHAETKKLRAAEGAVDELRHFTEKALFALKDILDVAEREIMGYPINREEWYARRDYARIVLEDGPIKMESQNG